MNLETSRLPDVDGKPDGITRIRLAGGPVEMTLTVERDSALRRRGLVVPFIGHVGWGSRNGLTLDEAESFASAVLDAVWAGRDEIRTRNMESTDVDSPPQP